MIQYLTQDDLYSQILLLRNVDSRIFLLVEGEADLGTLDPHVDEKSCEILLGNGKSAVVQAIELADKNSVKRVLGIIDRDWTGDLYPIHPSPNLVYTDWYDIDATLILSTGVVGRVVPNFCNRERRRLHLSRIGVSDVTELIVKVAAPIGALRRVSLRDSLGLHLRNFPIRGVVDGNLGITDLDKLVAIANVRSKSDHGLSELEIHRRLEEGLAEIENYAYLCSGHDLLAALSFFLNSRWGGSVGAKLIGCAIRAALSCVELTGTQLYLAAERWGSTHDVRIWNCVIN